MSIGFDGRKGDLAFWYNIDRNLNVDYLTFHGGCPVLVGSKWITNKWIRCIPTLSIFCANMYTVAIPLVHPGFSGKC